MKSAVMVLILGIAGSAVGEIQAPGEELPLDLWLASGRDALGMGWRSGGAARMRGEWTGRNWQCLADRSGSESPRVSAAWWGDSFRLSLGSLRREEGLLGQERRRARLGSMISSRTKPSALSLGDQGRGAFLDLRSSSIKTRLGWQEQLGFLADLSWRPWTLRLRSGTASLGFRRSSGHELLEVESALAENGVRQGLRLRAASRIGSLAWSAEGLLLGGPRPETWSSRGWIGADSGQEAHLATSWRGGPLRWRIGLRWRRGLGLPDYRRRREILMTAAWKRARESWRLELRRLEDRDSVLAETPAVFPVWETIMSGAWELRLARRAPLSWEALIRGGEGSERSTLLRLDLPQRQLGSGLEVGGKATFYRCPESESFRIVSGGFLARRSRSLRGRGAVLGLSLIWRGPPYSLRLDADLGTDLRPEASLVLGWQAL